MIAPENKALRPPLKSLPQADGSGKPAAVGSGNWRDPAIFGPLDKKIRHGEPTSPSSRRRKSQRDPQALSPVRAKELEAIIRKQVGPISDFIREHCAAQLRYRPESLKRLVLSLIRKQPARRPSASLPLRGHASARRGVVRRRTARGGDGAGGEGSRCR